MKQLTLPRALRTLDDRVGLLNLLPSAHFFECSAIMDYAVPLGEKWFKENSALPMTTVLPAEKTWIETCTSDSRSSRYGVLLDASDLRVGRWYWAAWLRGDAAQRRFVGLRDDVSFGAVHGGDFNFSTGKRPICTIDRMQEGGPTAAAERTSWLIERTIPALLCFINTPKICKRVLRTSNKNLARRLTSGMWPLLGWNEIKINIDRKLIEETGTDRPLTGRKALHFVRTFFRIQSGKLVMVRPHWRGDASLGVVNSRYRVIRDDAGEATDAG